VQAIPHARVQKRGCIPFMFQPTDHRGLFGNTLCTATGYIRKPAFMVPEVTELTVVYSASQPHLYHHNPKLSPSKTPPTPPRTQTRNHPPQPNQRRHTTPLSLSTSGPRSTTSNGSKPRKVPTGASSHQKTLSQTMPGGRLFRVGRAGSWRIS
jgi:hypothetical protein